MTRLPLRVNLKEANQRGSNRHSSQDDAKGTFRDQCGLRIEVSSKPVSGPELWLGCEGALVRIDFAEPGFGKYCQDKSNFVAFGTMASRAVAPSHSNGFAIEL